MTLAELLAKADAADDLEFAGPDGVKFKLADLRTFQKTADAEQKVIAAKKAEAERLATEADILLKSLQLAIEESKKRETKHDEPPKSIWEDPLYQPLKPEFESVGKALTEVKAIAEAMKKSLDQSQAIYALERLRSQWDRAPVKPKDKTFEQVTAEILAAKELDKLGLPTLEKYLYRASEPERIAAATKEAVETARKQWEQEHKMANVPKPGMNVKVKGKTEAPIKKIEELTSDLVANDPDIIAAMQGPVQ